MSNKKEPQAGSVYKQVCSRIEVTREAVNNIIKRETEYVLDVKLIYKAIANINSSILYLAKEIDKLAKSKE